MDGRWLWSGRTELTGRMRRRQISSDGTACYSGRCWLTSAEADFVRNQRIEVVTREVRSRLHVYGDGIFLFDRKFPSNKNAPQGCALAQKEYAASQLCSARKAVKPLKIEGMEAEVGLPTLLFEKG